MEKKNQEINEIYIAYGKFAIEYEQLCFSINICITKLLEKDGLKDTRLSGILLSDQTAYPLITKLKTIIAVVFETNPDIVKHLNPLFNFCLDIIEKRNKIIHGTWFVGIGKNNSTDFSVAYGSKVKAKPNKGLDIDFMEYNPTHFETLTESIIKAKLNFAELTGILMFEQDLSKIKNIKIN